MNISIAQWRCWHACTSHPLLVMYSATIELPFARSVIDAGAIVQGRGPGREVSEITGTTQSAPVCSSLHRERAYLVDGVLSPCGEAIMNVQTLFDVKDKVSSHGSGSCTSWLTRGCAGHWRWPRRGRDGPSIVRPFTPVSSNTRLPRATSRTVPR